MPSHRKKPSRTPPTSGQTRTGALLTPEEKKLFRRAIELFNERKFWEAHEEFEELWRLAKGDAKTYVQGLVQAAAAFSYIKLGRYQSVLYLFDKSIEKLNETMHVIPRTNTAALIEAMKLAKEKVQQLGEENLSHFDISLYPRLADFVGSGRHNPRGGTKSSRHK